MEFVPLPREGRKKYDWDKITSQLKARPGEWGIVNGERTAVGAGAAQAVARAIREGDNKQMPKGEFESTTRGNTVYARYVGNRD